MATLRNVLPLQEADTVEQLYDFFCNGLQKMGNIWGERPYLHRGRIFFQRRNKNIITVVEIFFVLGGLYRNGYYYKATPLPDSPGLFAYEHKLIPYRLSSATWRKAAEKYLNEVVRTLITEKSNEIPLFVSKLVVKEGSRSLQILCRFQGRKSSTFSVILTPAFEGAGWPEGLGKSEGECVKVDVDRYPHWFLVAPADGTEDTYGWELVFPNITEGSLKPDDGMQAALLLSWLAENQGWHNLGLQNMSSAFQTLAMNAALIEYDSGGGGFHHCVKVLLAELLLKIRTGCLRDFGVPTLNYLEGITEKQQWDFIREVEEVLKKIENLEGLKELCYEYPLLIPTDDELGGSSYDDMIHLGVNPDTRWLYNAGSEEVSFFMSKPPPEDARILPTYKGIAYTRGMDKSEIERRIALCCKNEGCWDGGHVFLLVLIILLVTAFVVFVLPYLFDQLDQIHAYFSQVTTVVIEIKTTSILPEYEVLPEPSELLAAS